MHIGDDHSLSSQKTSAEAAVFTSGPWWRELNRYHWFVLVMAALGWLFDTMDQQLFVRVRNSALLDLLGSDADTTKYGGWATAIFIIGWATGGLVFGLFGDRWGRARTMMLTILIYSAFTGLSALSRSWWDFALYRFITGMGVGGEFAAGVSLVAEVMPARARPHALGMLQALSAIGNMSAVGVSFLLPPMQSYGGVAGWRLQFLVGILPALLVVVMFRKLREPDSWLRARERMKQSAGSDELQRQMGDMGELFRDPRWRRHTILGVLLAMVGVMGLWGIAFWTPELVENNVLVDLEPKTRQWYSTWGLFLQNFGGFFGVYAFTMLTARLGRRPAFAIALTAGLASIVLVFGFMTSPNQIWWMSPLLGFCTLMIFGGYAIYFPELFPTRLRSTGTSFCYNVARYLAAFAPSMLGTIAAWYLAPAGSDRAAHKFSNLTWLSSLGSVDNAFRYAMLTVACIYLVGLIVLPFAPETKGQPLPE